MRTTNTLPQRYGLQCLTS
uniref:Uncharacterized protein n=1 Tax=Arundo donax TaxID=35708 RepID=A0A0A8YE43_ARUDO